MEYINENESRVGASLHINEVLKKGILLLDEFYRGVGSEIESKFSVEHFKSLESNLPIFEGSVAIYDCDNCSLEEVAIAVFESLGFKYSSFKSDVSDKLWEDLETVVNKLKNKPIYFHLK